MIAPESRRKLLEHLARTATQLRDAIDDTTRRLEAEGLDPVEARDANGRVILLDALSALGQVEAAVANLALAP